MHSTWSSPYSKAVLAGRFSLRPIYIWSSARASQDPASRRVVTVTHSGEAASSTQETCGSAQLKWSPCTAMFHVRLVSVWFVKHKLRQVKHSHRLRSRPISSSCVNARPGGYLGYRPQLVTTWVRVVNICMGTGCSKSGSFRLFLWDVGGSQRVHVGSMPSVRSACLIWWVPATHAANLIRSTIFYR